jgi:hypothetical protein
MEEGKRILPPFCAPFMGDEVRARSWARARLTSSPTVTWCDGTGGSRWVAPIPCTCGLGWLTGGDLGWFKRPGLTVVGGLGPIH